MDCGERDLELAWLPFAHGQGLADYLTDPAFRAALPAPPERDPAAAVRHFLALVSDADLTWDDLAWLWRQTRLPILLKGLLHPGDAREAVTSPDALPAVAFARRCGGRVRRDGHGACSQSSGPVGPIRGASRGQQRQDRVERPQ